MDIKHLHTILLLVNFYSNMIFVAPDLNRLSSEIGRAFHPYYLFSPPHATCSRKGLLA